MVFVPLDGWLAYLGEDPAAVADRIENAAFELLRRWKNRNLTLRGEDRKPLAWAEEITRYSWKGPTGKKETTVWEVQLNTFALTRDHLYEKNPAVGTDEVKLLLKARTSVNAENRPDKSNVGADGLASDNKG